MPRKMNLNVLENVKADFRDLRNAGKTIFQRHRRSLTGMRGR